ncbi:MAG TPA: hypothetical protein VFQ27_08435 [Xanthobacteraceae bacterium]|nr:hypothetical protein [Xanthobacteraceae bacterium]
MSPKVSATVFVMGLLLAGCAGTREPLAPAAPPPVVNAPPAPGIAPEDLVGRWGFASYHQEGDRARTITQARNQCRHPYVIGRGPNGGVMMHLADQSQPTELFTKAGPEGGRFIGPAGPAGDASDREIVSFDGRVLILRWLDREVAGRYGTAVYVRCAPRA